jgi:RND family efflux transporter MFP subunit
MLSGAPSDAADLDCLIEPHVVVQVTPSVDGLLEQVAVDRGDLVERGQLVATLESSQEKATVLLAAARARIESPLKSSQARLEFGERRLARTLDLFQKELIPLREMDEAETAKVLAEIAVLEAGENRRIAELELERATAALQLRSVASPVTGVVMERFLSAGEYVKQTPILKIAQIDPLRVEVIAPVALLGRLAPGMEAVVMPEAPAGGTYRARVKVVDRVVDAASGTFGIRLELPNPGYKLAGGLKCKVRFPSVRK